MDDFIQRILFFFSWVKEKLKTQKLKTPISILLVATFK